ncbi:hypothetical protein LCGC14_0711400 [marine sediment metagenome]
MGFHNNLVNDGIFDDNEGLAGFYGDIPFEVLGAFPPVFNDMEVLMTNGLDLSVSVEVENHCNFIYGDIRTSKTVPFVSLHFQQNSEYNGARNISKVNGYVEIRDKQNFIFPVGDDKELRPLLLNAQGITTTARCAYFSKDENNSLSFYDSHSTESKEPKLSAISSKEFWRLENTMLSSIQIPWNERSIIKGLTDTVDEVVVVGWSKLRNQWESLSGNAVGDLFNGIASSTNFKPNEYDAFTFGALKSPNQFIDLPNYLVTPNGDGINDFLDIPELEAFPKNHLRIFDRNGLLVFKQDNYSNEFKGYANEGDIIIDWQKGLPSGVYFYIITFEDNTLEFQGFLYLKNN